MSSSLASSLAMPTILEGGSEASQSNTTENHDTWVSLSSADGSGGIGDDDFEIDPDAVDFEPLLISGTGKILAYHSSSFYADAEYGNDDAPVPAFIFGNGKAANDHHHLRGGGAAEIGSDGNRKRRIRPRIAGWLAVGIFFFIGAKSWKKFELVTQNPETSVAKAKVKSKRWRAKYEWPDAKSMMGYDLLSSADADADGEEHSPRRMDPSLEQNLADVGDGAFSAASHVVHWNRPWRADRKIQKTLAGVMARCANRTIYDYDVDDASGAYRLRTAGAQNDRRSAAVPARLLDRSLDPSLGPAAIFFTPDLRRVARDFFDSRMKGRAFTVFHDPLDSYLEHTAEIEAVEGYASSQSSSGGDGTQNTYNPMIRTLAGVSLDRPVDRKDLEIAKNLLGGKFLVGMCAHPEETMRRIGVYMDWETPMVSEGSTVSTSPGSTPNSETTRGGGSGGGTGQIIRQKECHVEQNKFIQQCRGGRDRRRTYDLRTNELVRFRHRYDILLFEYAVRIYGEQEALFLDA